MTITYHSGKRIQGLSSPSLVIYNTSGGRTYTTTTPATISLTVGSNSNRILIVWIVSGSANPVSSITWQSTNLTKLDTVSTTGGYEELWYLIAPATGTASVTINISGGAGINATADVYYNVNQTSPFGTVQKNTGTASPASLTVSTTTTQSNSIVVAGYGATQGGGTSVSLTGTNNSNTNSGGGYASISGYQNASSIGSYSFTGSFSDSVYTTQKQMLIVVELFAYGDTKPTNVPVGSRFEETDTRKIFSLTDPLVYSTDFSSSTGWVFNTAEATITGGVLQITNNSPNDNNRATYDFSSLVSGGFADNTVGWVLRFKLILNNYINTASGQGVGLRVGLSDSINVDGEDPSASVDAICFMIAAHAATAQSNFYALSLISAYSTATGITRANPLTVTRWIELVWNAVTRDFKVKVYTDSTFTTLEETITRNESVANAAALNDLKYIFAQFYYQNLSTVNTPQIDDLKFYNGVTSVGNYWRTQQ